MKNDFNPEWITQDNINVVTRSIVTENVRRVGTLIAATKTTYWKENHHVGQHLNLSTSGSFVKKTIGALYSGADIGTMITIAHRVGHWASTRNVLKQLGVLGLKVVCPATRTPDSLQASNDIELRLTSPPAGVGRTAVAIVLYDRMIKHPLGAFCPQISDFNVLHALKMQINNPNGRASFHVGAKYLTGDRANFTDEPQGRLLGRAGTLGNSICPGHTIMNSPHVANENYKKADDYDIQFEQLCRAYKKANQARYHAIMAEARNLPIEQSADYAAACTTAGVTMHPEAVKLIEGIRAAQLARQQQMRQFQAQNPVFDQMEDENMGA